MLKKIIVIFIVVCLLLLIPTSYCFADTGSSSFNYSTSQYFVPILANYTWSSSTSKYVLLRTTFSFTYDTTGLTSLKSQYGQRFQSTSTYESNGRYTDSNTKTNYSLYFYNLNNSSWSSSFITNQGTVGSASLPGYGYTYCSFGNAYSGSTLLCMPFIVFYDFHSQPQDFTSLEVYTRSGLTDNETWSQTYLVPGSQLIPPSLNNYHFFILRYTYINSINSSQGGITFCLPCPADYSLNYRSYNLLDSDNVNYQSGYNAGYFEGVNEASDGAYSRGYDIGLQTGKALGRTEGYNEAISSGSADNTFVGLISAAIDVPLRTISSLFDYEILGINLEQFFFSLLSIGILIYVLKIFIR